MFDLGIYPAAIPADDNSIVWGEVYETSEPAPVLAVLDEIEGYRPNEPDRSLYTRVLADVTLEDGRVEKAWTYFYNAPLGRRAAHHVRRLSRSPERALSPAAAIFSLASASTNARMAAATRSEGSMNSTPVR